MLHVYYRTPSSDGKLKLRCIAADVEYYRDAEQAVLEQLHIDMERFMKPVLVLIQGGLENK